MLARTVVACTLVVLAHTGLSRARPLTPEIQTSNLPIGICPSAGNYLLPDITDSTSYYVCCGDQHTTVRKTCRYDAIGGGQYDVLTAATYNSAAGECDSKPTSMTSGSFRSPATSAAPNATDQLRYRFSPAVSNAEAEATCKSAATPPVSEDVITRAASATLMEAAVSGQWSLVLNAQGVSSTGVVTINAVLLPASDKVLVWARVHVDGSKDNYQAGLMGADGVPEVSTVYDTVSGAYKVKQMRNTPFCTGQTILPSGQVLVTGGDDLSTTVTPGYTPGLQGIRLYNPANNNPGAANWNKGNWETLPDQLRSPRWYPTQALLPDGNRVVILGGRASQSGQNINSAEIYDHQQRKTVAESGIKFLLDLPNGYTLFPVMYVLPYRPTNKDDVQLFMFSCDRAAVETLRPDNSWADSVGIGSAAWPSPGFCGAQSMSGTATMLMLEPATRYLPEVVMFGGYNTTNMQCSCDTPTSEWAHRIKLDKNTVDNKSFAWTREKMPYGRNLNDAVLLPSGKVLVVNGAKSGVVDNLRDAAYDAWLYDPKAADGNRFTTLAPATVKRYYHSVALLLPDGSVMTSGSELGQCTEACARGTSYDFQHQAERFLPPYFFTGGRPRITGVSAKNVRFGGTVEVSYKGKVTGAVIMTPAAVTHQVNMNQRGVKIAVVRNAKGKVRVRMPPGSYITHPGYHMLFLMNGDTPCTRAAWVKLNP